MRFRDMIKGAQQDAQVNTIDEEQQEMEECIAQFVMDFGQTTYDDLGLLPYMVRDPEYRDHAALLASDGEIGKTAFIFKSGSTWMVKQNVNHEAHSVRFEGALTSSARRQALLLKLGYIWGI